MTRTTLVLAPNPSIYTGPGTNTYLVGAGPSVFCIDPGPDIDAHLQAILAAASARSAKIASILLTHSHPDHRPLAAKLSANTGAEVHCFEPSRGAAATALHDGERAQLGETELTVVHTPGHARDHVCFFDADTGALYSGDHVLSGMTSFIDPDDGDMSDYMASLRRILALQPRVIHPGHGESVEPAVPLIEEYIAHREMREQQIIGAVRDRARTTAEIVAGIYAGYSEALHPLAALTVHAHLKKLVGEGRVVREPPDDQRRYRLVT